MHLIKCQASNDSNTAMIQMDFAKKIYLFAPE